MHSTKDFSIHPLFYLLAFVMLITGRGYVFLCSILTVLLHELSHSIIAKSRGYMANNVVLTPFGAILYGNERMDKRSEFYVAIAGPICNFLLAICCIALWWIFPDMYKYTYAFVRANIVIALFNLFPAYPLDGARMALSFAKNRVKAIKNLRYIGIALSIALMILFVASIWFGVNYNLGIMAVFIYVGASFYTSKELIGYISYLDTSSKAYGEGVKEQIMIIGCDMPLVKILKLIKPNSIYTFKVVDSDGSVVGVYKENEMKKLIFSHKLSTPIGKLIES